MYHRSSPITLFLHNHLRTPISLPFGTMPFQFLLIVPGFLLFFLWVSQFSSTRIPFPRPPTSVVYLFITCLSLSFCPPLP